MKIINGFEKMRNNVKCSVKISINKRLNYKVMSRCRWRALTMKSRVSGGRHIAVTEF